MMEHQRVRDQLVLIDDPELPAPERQRLLAHVAVCRECAADLQHWRSLHGALAGAPQPAPSEVFVEAVMRRVSPAAAPVRRRWTVPWWIPQLGLGLAGVVCLLTLAQPSTPVTTGTLLLAGVPRGAEWEFASEAPDAGALFNQTAESSP